ncbi:putative Ig domain-containing protein [uncultured Umboniibacter sp.]|uniref:putative Ig domain-containing protein n=1 Tax=uncultured Umboniibacter sp. TaxID=1798917 RepID=UPI00263228C8|nr:putative Ig domain-containing protein [uncultured Umboniibacter sp.]
MIVTKNLRFLFITLPLILAVGCGGSGGDSPEDTTPSNRAPIISNTIEDIIVAANEEIDLDVTQNSTTFSDPDGDSLTYDVTLSEEGAGLTVDGNRVVGQLDDTTKVTVTVTATDSTGASVTIQFEITLLKPEISGRVTYEDVPATSSGLDYAETETKPVRGALIELLDQQNNVIEAAVTKPNGRYEFTAIALDEVVRVRVKAALVSQQGTLYVKVVDNTQDFSLYAAETELGSLRALGSNRDIHLASGWSNGSYSESRSAAPFAILDTLYGVSSNVIQNLPSVVLPNLEVYWSTLNVPEDGDVTAGKIGTDSYFQNVIYLLGSEDVDTTEYDDGTIAHEWVHFFQDVISRDDSIGGPHSGNDRLDLRVAFSEGYATGLGIFLMDGNEYIDTYGSGQRSAFVLDPERTSTNARGWYNEVSIMNLVYDILDTSSDDELEVSLADILSLHQNLQSAPEFISIFSWASRLLPMLSINDAEQFGALLNSQSINSVGIDRLGSNEQNDSGSTFTLPVTDTLLLNNPIVRCMDDTYGTYNKLGNSRFYRFQAVAETRYTIQVNRVSGGTYPPSVTPGDPDFFVYYEDNFLAVGGSGVEDREEVSFTATQSGEHRLALREYLISEDLTPRDDTYCYSTTISLEQ